MPRPLSKSPDRYRFRFFGRLVQKLTTSVAQEKEWTQGQVADWLGVSADQLSRWILGHTHPSTEDDWAKLKKLTPDLEQLEMLAVQDKLDYFRRETDLSPETLAKLAERIEAYDRRKHD